MCLLNKAVLRYSYRKVYEGGQQWRGGYRGDRGSPLGGTLVAYFYAAVASF